MSYVDDVKRLLADFSESDKEQLFHRLEIDLYQPELMLSHHHVSGSFMKELARMEAKYMKKLHSEQEFPTPEGRACSFCGRTESEVPDMAMHESGFSVCKICVDTCADVLRDQQGP